MVPNKVNILSSENGIHARNARRTRCAVKITRWGCVDPSESMGNGHVQSRAQRNTNALLYFYVIVFISMNLTYKEVIKLLHLY